MNISILLNVYMSGKTPIFIFLMKKIAKFAKKLLPQQFTQQTYLIPCKYGNECKFYLIGTCKYFHPWSSYDQSCKHILNCPDYKDGACKYHKPGKSLNCYYGTDCKYYKGGKGKCRNYHPLPQAPDHQIQMMMSKLDLNSKIQVKEEPFQWYIFKFSRFPKKSSFKEWLVENWVFEGTDVMQIERLHGENARIRMKVSAFQKLNGKLYNGQAVWFAGQ